MEGVWKRDIWLGCRALDLKARNGDRSRDVHLGKMDVGSGTRRRSPNVAASRHLDRLRHGSNLGDQVSGERIFKMLQLITTAYLVSGAVNDRGSNAEGCQTPCELRLGHGQGIRPWTVVANA